MKKTNEAMKIMKKRTKSWTDKNKQKCSGANRSTYINWSNEVYNEIRERTKKMNEPTK